MCGIVAALGPCVSELETGLVRAARTLIHRGPDAGGEVAGELFALAHRRLEIIDPGPGGAQPMRKARTALVFNGEIYNYRELREGLEREGIEFHSNSDTEVLLELVRSKWDRALTLLDGMYAFVAVDEDRGMALCARDPLGEKPLLFQRRAGGVVLASEVAAFRHLGILRSDLNPVAMAQFLCLGYTLPPHTIYAGLSSLLPGEYLEVNLRDGSARSGRFYDVSERLLALGTRATDEPDYEEQFGSAVSSRLVADVDVGLMLSGGIDSTLVAALAAGSPKRLRAYTAGPIARERINELEVAARNCRQLGIEHTAVVWEGDAHVDELLHAVSGYELPFADVTSWAVQRIARRAREGGIKVLLSGDGGDELLAGYPKRRFQKALIMLQSVLEVRARGAMATAVERVVPCCFSRVRKFGRLIGIRGWKDALLAGLGNGLLPDEAEELVGARPEVEGFTDRTIDPDLLASEPQTLITLLDMVGHVRGNALYKCDFFGMRESVEIRVPLLSQALVEAIVPISGRLSAVGLNGKRPMRRLIRRTAPGVACSSRKIGFTPFDLEALVRRMLPKIRCTLKTGSLADCSAQSRRVIRKVCEAYESRSLTSVNSVWRLYVLEEWARKRGCALRGAAAA